MREICRASFWLLVATPAGLALASAEPPSAMPSIGESEVDLLVAAPEPSEGLGVQIDAWIRDLGAPRAIIREAASDRLAANGAVALRRLHQAYVRSRDLEVRMRIERMVREVYLQERLFSRHAFLGISMEPDQITHAMDPRVPEGGEGIRIGNIVPGTSAEQSDLRPRDIIILLDGEPVHSMRTLGHPGSFSEILRRRGVGAELVLTVIRRDEVVEVPVTLGSRPREYYRSMESPELAEQKRRVELDFQGWWREQFQARASQPQSDQVAPQRQ